MPDLSVRWPAEPDWQTTLIDRPGLSVRRLHGLDQLLVSGDLAAWHYTLGTDEEKGPVTAMGEDAYNVRVARDRVLAVSDEPFDAAPGWHDRGFAVTRVSAALAVLELHGTEIAWLLERATSGDPFHTSLSAAISFAGLPATAYFRDGRFRLHVDRALAAYAIEWMKDRLENSH